MKLPPFTLVHDPRAARRPRGVRQMLANSARAVAPDLAADLLSIKPALGRTLLRSLLRERRAPARGASTLSRVIGELKRQSRVVTVGIWDLDSQVGRLPAVIERLNEVQPVFALFEVQAALPMGLVSRPTRVQEWASARIGKRSAARVADEFGDNVIFEEFSGGAERIRRDLGVDYLIAITPNMVAFEDDDFIYWACFSCVEKRIVLASSYEMSVYARQARVPFEAAVAGIALSGLLVALNFTSLDFHDEVRDCLFDDNEERNTVVKSLRDIHIETQCLERIKPQYRAAAEALATALHKYGR
jgi:hypothetical protein